MLTVTQNLQMIVYVYFACKYVISFMNVSGQFCGATFVAPNAVVTAAHCLYDDVSERWAYYEEVSVFKGDFSDIHWPYHAHEYGCKTSQSTFQSM